MTTTAGPRVGLARLTVTRGLISAAAAAIAIIWGYAAFIFSDSAFLTGLLDTAYTVAFAAAASWLTTGRWPLSPRASIAVSGLASAAVTVVLGLLLSPNDYWWRLLLVVVIGAIMGLSYPAWYALLRRGRDGDEFYGQIGIYESCRVVAVLLGTSGCGLLGRLLGLETTTVLIAVVFAAGGLLALSFPRSRAGDRMPPKRADGPVGPLDAQVHHRIRLLFGLLAAIQLMLAPIVAVVAVLAVRDDHGGVAQVGLLSSLFGAGSAAQFVTTKVAARGVNVRVLVSAILTLMLGCAVLAAVWDTAVTDALLMVSFGFGVTSIGTLINAEIQLSVPESVRDRYVSGFALVFALPLAAGSSLWGLAADYLPVPTIAVISTTSTCVVAILLLAWRRVSGHRAVQGDPEPGHSTR